MQLVAATGDPPPQSAIDAAVRAISAGLVVAVPTDTVYGLAVDPTLPGASDRLFEAKRRPREVELPVLVAGMDQALGLTVALPAAARRLMERFWPGALTLVVPRNPEFAADLGDEDLTIGLRCPDHPVPLALCARLGPLATTSANLHGEPTAETAPGVAAALGPAVALVLDAGPCAGSPSTVVDCTGDEPRCLREGRLPWAEVLAALA